MSIQWIMQQMIYLLFVNHLNICTNKDIFYSRSEIKSAESILFALFSAPRILVLCPWS